jgi:hypothetical protein
MMCEASSLYPFREARKGDIAKIGTVPNLSMKGLFEDGKVIKEGPQVGSRYRQPADRALLVCAQNGARIFIERMNLILNSRMHNYEFARAENYECQFYMTGREFAEGDGFKMQNGVFVPLTELVDGTRVRIERAFA